MIPHTLEGVLTDGPRTAVSCLHREPQRDIPRHRQLGAGDLTSSVSGDAYSGHDMPLHSKQRTSASGAAARFKYRTLGTFPRRSPHYYPFGTARGITASHFAGERPQ